MRHILGTQWSFLIKNRSKIRFSVKNDHCVPHGVLIKSGVLFAWIRYTKFFSKIAPCAKGEKNYQKLQVIRTILLKISNLEANLEIFKRIVRITCIFSLFFYPSRTERFWKKICIVSTNTKLHVQGKKSPFWIFHRGHDVSISLPGSVNKLYFYSIYQCIY